MVTGPIRGIPADEVVAWIASWECGPPLAEPEPRWIELI